MPFITARVVSVVQDDAIAALADAGPDQSVLCAALVQLQADIIGDDIENHTFEWEQTFGTPVTLINPDTLTPSFVNPLVSDLEFTFYLDRNTPFEDSDVVIVSRAPQNQVTAVGGGTGMIGFSGISRIGSPANAQNLIQRDARVSGWGFTNPPSARYSPIFEASDLDRVRENVSGDYWLMRDIDLSEYPNWDPIGTVARPFTGDFQGNGFKIENLSITSSPILVEGGDALWSEVQLLAKFEGNDGDTFYTELSTNAANASFDADAEIDTMESKFGNGSALFNRLGSNNDEITFSDIAAYDHGTGDWTHEGFVQFNNVPMFGGTQAILSLIGTTDVIIFEITDNSGHEVLISGNGWSEQASISSANSFQWYHWAVCREAGTIRAYWDGNYVVSDLDAADADMGNASQGVRLGALDAGGTNSFDGWIDNYRMTIGTARYSGTGSITVPTTDFDTTGSTYKDVGLFSGIGNGALIEKVGITNATISDVGSSAYRGILAGRVTADVTVNDCYVEGTVASGSGTAGGFIGDTGTNASSTFTNTYADVTVTGGGVIGGWAGSFSGTPTYVENYTNTTKTINVVGAGSPGGTEVSGLTTAQLTAEANYTGWDFTSTWEIDEGVSPATIQRDDTFVRATAEHDDQWMIVWSTPDVTTFQVNSPLYVHKGTIIEEAIGNAWGFPRFIPKNRHGGLMTPDTTHRITTVWDVLHDATDAKPYTSSYVNEIQIINEEKFTSKNTSSRFGPYANDNITGAWGGGAIGITEDFTITISNPRKITMQQDELGTYGPAGSTAVTDDISINRFVGAQMLPITEDTIAGSAGGATGWDLDLVIVRVNGASIG